LLITLDLATSKVDVYPFEWDASTTIYLVDTPGFDDTEKSDSDVLREIAAWLTYSFKNDVKLSGIVYLHRISDKRMQGSARKNLFMFKRLCGPDALKRVILATNMWDTVAAEVGSQREKELVDTPDFWGWMVDQGSKVFRHTNDRESAVRLLEHFVDSEHGMTLEIQEEMVLHRKALDETKAGIELEKELARERIKFKEELAQTQQDMRDALKAHDEQSAKLLQEHQEMTDAKIRRMDQERDDLKISLEKLHAKKYAQLERQLQVTRLEKESLAKSMEQQLAELRSRLESQTREALQRARKPTRPLQNLDRVLPSVSRDSTRPPLPSTLSP